MAKYYLSTLYRDGKGCRQDLNEARKLLKEAIRDKNLTEKFQTLSHEALIGIELLIATQEEKERHKKELEDIMAMFAHKFRGPLDSIAYLEKDPRVLEDVRIMGGLLNVFSLISTSENQLRDKLCNDLHGESSLEEVLKQALSIALATLLTRQHIKRMGQHYYHYAKQHGLINAETGWDDWIDRDLPHYKTEERLQQEWQSDFMEGQENAGLAEIVAWVGTHLFLLDIQGFDSPVRFARYGVTESTLLTIIQESVINALKYYAHRPEAPASLRISWQQEDERFVFRCVNPTSEYEYGSGKGSGKGHQFLSLLARKLGGEFHKPGYAEMFITEFRIPAELLALSDN